jgi:DNA-directed RNA polymerase subunit RPC12/RpoP
MMESGIHYEAKQHGRYEECPKCHERIEYKVKSNDGVVAKNKTLEG